MSATVLVHTATVLLEELEVRVGIPSDEGRTKGLGYRRLLFGRPGLEPLVPRNSTIIGGILVVDDDVPLGITVVSRFLCGNDRK